MLGGAVVNYFVNTTITELRSAEWQMLLSRFVYMHISHLLY